MTHNKKVARLDTVATSKTTSDSIHDTKSDALTGWFSLGANVKPSRSNRQPKRTWKRGQK